MNFFNKFFKAGLCLGLFSYLFASPFGNKLIVPITEMDSQDYAYVPAFDLRVGESGDIVRWFNNEHSGIIAKAAVIEIQDNKAKIAFEPYVGLEQKAFPTPTLTPQKNDEVIFRAFNDRALLIAPSQEIYQKVLEAYPDVTWTHPDLFAAYLVGVNHLAPVKSDFRNICAQYAIGIIYMVNLNEGQALDCQTFAVMKKDYISGRAAIEDRMRPFFSRIGKINQDWFSYLIGGISVDDYYLYYDALLKGEIEDNEATFFGRVSKYLTKQVEDIFKGEVKQ